MSVAQITEWQSTVAHLEATGAFPSRASKKAASSIETTTPGDEETPRAPDPELVDRLINGGSAPRPEATAATSTPLGRESAQIIRQSKLDDEDRAAAKAAAEAAMIAVATRRNPMPLCTFHIQGACRRGPGCPFRH